MSDTFELKMSLGAMLKLQKRSDDDVYIRLSDEHTGATFSDRLKDGKANQLHEALSTMLFSERSHAKSSCESALTSDNQHDMPNGNLTIETGDAGGVKYKKLNWDVDKDRFTDEVYSMAVATPTHYYHIRNNLITMKGVILSYYPKGSPLMLEDLLFDTYDEAMAFTQNMHETAFGRLLMKWVEVSELGSAG